MELINFWLCILIVFSGICGGRTRVAIEQGRISIRGDLFWDFGRQSGTDNEPSQPGIRARQQQQQ